MKLLCCFFFFCVFCFSHRLSRSCATVCLWLDSVRITFLTVTRTISPRMWIYDCQSCVVFVAAIIHSYRALIITYTVLSFSLTFFSLSLIYIYKRETFCVCFFSRRPFCSRQLVLNWLLNFHFSQECKKKSHTHTIHIDVYMHMTALLLLLFAIKYTQFFVIFIAEVNQK